MATPTSGPQVTTTDEKPTIVIIQGSFQTPLVYEGLLKGLRAAGYEAFHPKLPSLSSTDSPQLPTLIDDALAVRSLLTKLVEYEKKTVLVVMHSYGGLVGSEGIPEELSYTKRREQSLSGGVIHLFFFSAFILSQGLSVLEAFGESENNSIRADGTFCIKNGAKLLYNDIPEAEAMLWESRLIPQSYQVQTIKLTRSSYMYIPSTYLICEDDQAVPSQYQEMFATSTNSQIERCSAGHSPMLSQLDMLVQKITTVADKAIAAEKSTK